MTTRSRARGSNRSRHNRRRRTGGGSPRSTGTDFWGDASALPASRHDVRITDDPDAVARSLGPPPLADHARIAEHFFAVVYDRAVMMAGAVAAAGGLIAASELLEDGAADQGEASTPAHRDR